MKEKAFIIAMLMAVLSAQAEDLLWYVVTDTGMSIEKNKVELLVAADDNTTFALVATDGTVLAEGVGSIRFEQRAAPAGITPIAAEGHDLRLIGGTVDSQLVLTGAKGTVSVYATDGRRMFSTEATGGVTRLNVQTLSSGIYVVKCGKAAFKFIKK